MTGTGEQYARQTSLLTKVSSPFDNPAPWTKYEILKAIVVGCTLFPLRILFLFLSAVSQAFFTRLVALGLPLENDRGCLYHKRPFGAFRRFLRLPVIVTNQLFLWSLGFWRIHVEDRRKNKSERANILVAGPHMNLADPFILTSVFRPMIAAVGKSELLDIPLICHTGVAGEGIFVDRRNPESRHGCKDAIAARADPAWKGLPLLIFPEGTTTNGKVLIQFKLGPFLPGQPITPVLLRYNCKYFNFAWVGANADMAHCILRMLLQFSNSCTVIILDQYFPSDEEKKDPVLFAKNVRTLMANELGVPTTEHSYDDVWFAVDAVKEKVGQDFSLGEVKQLYNMDLDALKILLKRFKQFDLGGEGTLSKADFEKALEIARSPASLDKFFSFFDTDGDGRISYREFIQGLALLSGRCSLESQAKLAFLVFDVDGNDKVKVTRLADALDKAVAMISTETSPGSRLLKTVGADKELSFDEFVALVEREPEILEAALSASRKRVGVSFETATAAATEKVEKKKDK